MEWTFELIVPRQVLEYRNSYQTFPWTFLGVHKCVDTRRGCALRLCLRLFPVPLPYRPDIFYHPLSHTNRFLSGTSILMSHSYVAVTSSSSNFQVVLNNALEAYKERAKEDLLAHPLASQLEACSSPAAILAVLHQQVQVVGRSQDRDDRWTKWLDPTVHVICTLSDGLGEGVGLVSLPDTILSEICTLTHIWQVFSPAKAIFVGVGILLSVRIINISA